MRRPYGQVLAVNGARRLLASGLLARLPQGMSTLAILLLVRGATHSYAAAGFAVGANALMTALMAPPLGRSIDRLGRARVLLPCAIVNAASLWGLDLAAGLHAGAVELVVFAGLAGASLPPIAPVVRALLREAFGEAVVRERAYALESVTQELIWISGPLVVALVITVFSPAVAVALLGVVGVVGTSLFVRGPLARDGARRSGSQAPAAALSSRLLRGLLVPIALNGAALGAIEVGLPSLALHAGSRSASGLLLALWSLGSMVGGLAYGARTWPGSLSARYALLLALAVACTVPLILARSIPAGIAGALLSGLTIAPVFSCQYALISHAATPGTETEAFTWVSAALVAGLAAGSAIGGALVSAAGESAPFVFSCSMGACAAATGAAVFGARRRAAVA